MSRYSLVLQGRRRVRIAETVLAAARAACKFAEGLSQKTSLSPSPQITNRAADAIAADRETSTMGKRRNEDAQISKAEYARREAKPTQGGGAFPRADAATLSPTAPRVPLLVARFAAAGARGLRHAHRVAEQVLQFAFAETALTSTPKEAIVDAARDYVRYAEQLEARFLPKDGGPRPSGG